MLSYLGRTLPVLLRAYVGRDASLVSRVERRVRLRDLDLNRHMNQAVYAQVMEIGRADWLIRSLALQRWRAGGISVVVASQHIVYRHELSLNTRYTLDTRALDMSGRLLRMQTNILVGARVHARNDTEVLFIGRQGVLGIEAARAASEGLLTDPLPVEAWKVADRADRIRG